jgi:hypothetical protein
MKARGLSRCGQTAPLEDAGGETRFLTGRASKDGVVAKLMRTDGLPESFLGDLLNWTMLHFRAAGRVVTARGACELSWGSNQRAAWSYRGAQGVYGRIWDS